MTFFGLKLILNTNTIILHQFNNIKKLNFNTINNIEKKMHRRITLGFVQSVAEKIIFNINSLLYFSSGWTFFNLAFNSYLHQNIFNGALVPGWTLKNSTAAQSPNVIRHAARQVCKFQTILF